MPIKFKKKDFPTYCQCIAYSFLLANRDDPSSSRKKHKKLLKKRRVKDMERSSGDSVTEDDEGKPDVVPVLPNNQEQHQSGMEADYESQDAGDRKKSPSGGAEGPLSSNAPEVKKIRNCHVFI